MTEMEKVTVNADALLAVLNALNGPGHYIDNEGSVIIVGYEAYRKTSWIDGDDRAIPASWKKLEVAANAPELTGDA